MFQRFVLLVMLFYAISASSAWHVVAQLPQEITIYTTSGEAIVQIHPAQSKIIRTEYLDGRPVRDTVEYRSLPALPWFFTKTGTFYAFTPQGKLRFYYTLDHYDEYTVSFSQHDIEQVIDDQTLLVHSRSNQLALWKRSFAEEIRQNVSLIDLDSARHLKASGMIAVTRENRLDYYTNPALGLVTSQLNYHTNLYQASGSMIQPIRSFVGGKLTYDELHQRLYFFRDQHLYMFDIQRMQEYQTPFNFRYIFRTVAGRWQIPEILALPNDRVLIWKRLDNNRDGLAQLALYDAQSGAEIQIWQYLGPQGSLTLVEEVL
ncbi:hypothetical protein PVA45_05210 [Entomospira entomophila]|uniref:Uncharacterized protein n=1 Tax=Entomospira entomophila TaxID=2719988 RepID=A0A968GAG1_9SPIO|nr:hypothetical protein [Entomospira entomophilus]NIZ40897.1 hypothetical protein [Entomospira entomophilus]WDI35110.1 hypothetical protein PVA45_05210 [Entomospira entomophilus]